MGRIGVPIFRIAGARITVVLAVAVGLSACETSGRIEESESILSLNMAQADWPGITRERTVHGYGSFEEWDWPNGGLYATRSKQARFHSNDYLDPEDLIEDLQYWRPINESRLDWRDVKIDRNQIGEFQYIVARHGRDLCFFMLQPFPIRQTPGRQFPDTAESSGGYITFYECRRRSSLTAEQIEERGLTFARALAKRW